MDFDETKNLPTDGAEQPQAERGLTETAGEQPAVAEADAPIPASGGITEASARPRSEEKPLPEQRNDGISVRYHLNKAQGMAALRYIDRKHNLVKRCIFTVLLLGLAVWFILSQILNPIEAEHNFLIGGICFGFAVFYWVITFVEMNKRAKAIGSMTRDFVLTLYPDCVGVGEYPTEEYLPYDAKLKVEEQRDCFIFSEADEKLFVLEKVRMSEGQIADFRARLHEALPQKQYVRKKDADDVPRPMGAQQ